MGNGNGLGEAWIPHEVVRGHPDRLLENYSKPLSMEDLHTIEPFILLSQGWSVLYVKSWS